MSFIIRQVTCKHVNSIMYSFIIYPADSNTNEPNGVGYRPSRKMYKHFGPYVNVNSTDKYLWRTP